VDPYPACAISSHEPQLTPIPERGVENQASLDNLSEKDVASALAKLAGQ
jgi:hypothetical protein